MLKSDKILQKLVYKVNISLEKSRNFEKSKTYRMNSKLVRKLIILSEMYAIWKKMFIKLLFIILFFIISFVNYLVNIWKSVFSNMPLSKKYLLSKNWFITSRILKFSHCTKLEEMLNEKLHFLCSITYF